MSRDFVGALLQLNAEKGVPREQLILTISDAIESAYRRIPGNEDVRVRIDPERGEMLVTRERRCVAVVEDPLTEMTLDEARAIKPDYALGGHTASLGLCWLPAGTLPGFSDGMVIGQHGSWNRSTLSGYKVVFVPFENGRPSGPPRDILSGFLAPDERESYGRPVGVTLGPDGSLLVADDVGNVIWRVTGA